MTEFIPITEKNTENTEFISGNVGRVGVNTELKIININTGQSLGPNLDGEICVKGPNMFTEYLHNIEATNDTIDREG